jgi:WD40 repeat protein/beta-lactamase regulating signal transducer with metallopeptidase domain
MSMGTDAVWLAIGWTMLHFLWVGGLIGITAAVALRALRDASPELRYGVALGALALLALAPAAIGWRTGLLGGVSRPEPMPEPAGQASTAMPPPLAPQVEKAPIAVIPAVPSGPSARPATIAAPGRATAVPRPLRFTAILDAVASRLPWLWLIGSPITFAWLALGLAGAERLRRGAVVADGELSELCDRLVRELGLARDVTVAVCERLAAPVLVGVVRPLILLPAASLGGWGPDQLEMVLLHELTHVRRWDNLVNLLQRLIESVLFFHPAVWIVSGWVRREREHCCDAMVVARTGRPRAYAETLLALSDTGPARTPRAAVAMARNDLVSRVRRILDHDQDEHAMKLPRGLLALAAAIVILPAGWTITRGHPAGPPAEVQAKEQAEAKTETSPSRAAGDGRDSRTATPIRLVDAQGRPVEGAVVGTHFYRNADTPPRFVPWGSIKATSDARGELSLMLESPARWGDQYLYALRSDGDQLLVGLGRVARGDLGKPIAIVMHPACRIRLRVECSGYHDAEEKYHVEPRGERWRRIGMVRPWEDPSNVSLLSTETMAGEVEFLLPPGRFRILIIGDLAHAQELSVTVEPGHRVKNLGIIDLDSGEMVRQGIFYDHHHLSQADRGGDDAASLRLRPVRWGLEPRGDLSMVYGLAYSPDGRTLATAHWNNVAAGGVKLWDMAAGRLEATLPAAVEKGGVEAVAFSPDGRWLAGVVGESATPAPPWSVVLWDVASRRQVRAMRGHTSRITAMAFAPDGRTLATGGDDATVRLWDVASGRVVGRIDANPAQIQSIAYAPDGKTLAIVSRFALRLWDVPGQRFRATIENGDFWVTAVAFAPDGRTLAAAGGTFVAPPGVNLNPNRREQEGRVRLYDMTLDPPARRAELVLGDEGPAKGLPFRANSFFSDVAFAPDGRRVVAVVDRAIMVWDAESGARQDIIRRRHGGSFDRLAVSPDGRWLAATQEYRAQVMDLVPPVR